MYLCPTLLWGSGYMADFFLTLMEGVRTGGVSVKKLHQEIVLYIYKSNGIVMKKSSCSL